MISRRRFLRSSLLSTALLGAAALVGRQLSGYRLDAATTAKLRALSPKQFLVMAAVARRICASDDPEAPSSDDTECALFIDSYVARLEPGLRKDVCALIELVEHGAGPLCGVASRFTHMSAAAQDATLDAWAHGRLAVQRQGFQALRSLAFMGYWRDVRTWPLLGYSGPMVTR